MTGTVDEAGRALLTLAVKPTEEQEATELVVWVDTAFDGELVVSAEFVNNLGLNRSAAINATLADGSAVVLETFQCLINWFGDWRAVEVIANAGRLPLLGIGLLQDRKLTVDYRTYELSLE